MKHIIFCITFLVLAAGAWGQEVIISQSSSGIDSSYNQNDSMFLALSDGTNVFSGLADIPINTGRVLYVSKASGNNATAQVGDFTKPWRDPWAARAVAQSGDFIYVFPGEYTIGFTGGVTEDAEITSETDRTKTLFFDGSYYFEKGAIISANMSTGVYNGYSFFDASGSSNGTNCLVSGFGTFTLEDEVFGYPPMLFYVNTSSSNSNFDFIGYEFKGSSLFLGEADSIGHLSFRLFNYNAIGNTGYTNVNKGITVIIENMIDRTSSAFNCGGNSNNYFYFDIKNWDQLDPVNTTQLGTSKYAAFLLGGISGQTNYVFQIKVGRYLTRATGTYQQAKFSRFLNGNGTTSSGTITINITDYIDRNPNPTPIFLAPTGSSSQPGICTYSFAIANGINIVGNVLSWTPSGGGVTDVFVDCQKCQLNHASPALSVTASSANTTITISGTYYSSSASALIFEDGSGVGGNIFVRDAYLKNTTAQSLINANTVAGRINVINSRLINNGSAAPIDNAINTSINVGCMGVYTNSTVTDPDIVETIQPITRNSNVK